jgi:multicomponent Na+:H+ antiporter subunit D
MLPLFIIVPLLVLILLNLPLGKVTGKPAVWAGLALCAAQVAVVLVRPDNFFTDGNVFKNYFTFHLAADSLSLVLLLSIGLVSFVTILVARATLTVPRELFHFMSVLFVAVIGMNGMCLVRDLFSLYVYLEITAIASFILIALKQGKDSLEGAFKYIILSAAASAMMLAAISLLLLTTGSTQFGEVAAAMKADSSHLFTRIAIGAFLCGVFVKGGLAPFHGWVLGAYSTGPAATSVLMAGIVSKVAGVYALIRLVTTIFGQSLAMDHVLLFIGIASALVGAMAALGQTDMRRLLAYSSISQVGYILLGLGCWSQTGPFLGLPEGAALTIGEVGLIGAVFHFFNHAVFQSLLFVNSAALEERAGTTDMTKLGGLGARMPWTSTTSVLGALSTAGVPPLSGFWSKLIIILALWQAQHYLYAMLAIVVSVLTLAYMLKMQRKVFFGLPSEAAEGVVEAPAGLVAPAVLLAVITAGVGVAVLFVPYIFHALATVVKT